MNRKKLLSIFTAITATAMLVFNSPAVFAAYDGTTIDSNLNAAQKPDHVTLTWSDDPTTTQTITWRTNVSVDQGVVKYVPLIPNGTVKTCDASKELFQTTIKPDRNTGSMNIFSAKVSGLIPGTRYAYRVGDGKNWSDMSTFTTEAKNTDKFKFMIFGDSQSGNADVPNYAPWNTTIENAYSANQDAKFFINMGDIVERGQYYVHWNNWFDAAKSVINTIPEMPVQGNHETYVASTEDSVKPVYFINQFKVPQNGPDGFKGQTYSYNYGNAHFVVLDSQEDEEAPNDDTFLKKQADWLDADLKNNKQKFTFVFFHKTPYYNKALRCNVAVDNILTPVIEKYHVDIVFNGHDHAVSRTYPIKNGQYFGSPAQGTIYYVTGRSGNKYYNDLQSKIWDAFYYDPQDEPCYETVQINGDKACVDAFKQDGTKLDELVIDKDDDANSTKANVLGKFNKTRLAMFGTQITFGSNQAEVVNGKVYVNPSLIAEYIGGSYDTTNHVLNYTGGGSGKNYTFTFNAGDILKDGNISIDALNATQDLNCVYNSNLNFVNVDLKSFN